MKRERKSQPEDPKGASKSRRRVSRKVRLLAWGLFIVSTLFLLEVAARIAAAMNLVTIRHFETEDGVKELEFVADISEFTGVWHLPNASVEVAAPLGSVTYKTNAHGMRDRPREKKKQAAKRVIALGDSFVEGWNVPAEHRFTDVLEERTGTEVLNFGCSGDFGTIQEWLLYRHVASEFTHSDVALFFLPDNDFKDNDPARNPPKRYRPYLRPHSASGETDRADGEPGERFEVYYPREFKPVTEKRVRLSAGKKFRHQLYNRSHFCNLLSNINFHSDTRSAYTGFTEDDWQRVAYSLTQLAEDVGSARRLTIFIIPRSDDLRIAEDPAAGPSITTKLTAWARTQTQRGSGAQVHIVDLKPGFKAWLEQDGNRLRALFIPGNGHWTKLGHEVASNLIAPHITPAQR